MKTIQNKWKNVKANARRRDQLAKKSQSQTGGGKLTRAEIRIVNSNLLGDVATKLGVSARGADPRFDSDSNSSVPPSGRSSSVPSAPTRRLERLKRTVSYVDVDVDDDTCMSGKSKDSFDTSSIDASDETSIGLYGEFSRSLASNDDSSRENVSHSTPNSMVKRKKHPRDIQNELMSQNLQQHQSNLLKQNECSVHQNTYWKLQAERAGTSNEHEKLKKQMTEIGIEKATIEKDRLKSLSQIDIDKQAELAKIEIEKQKEIVKMELEAKRKQLGI